MDPIPDLQVHLRDYVWMKPIDGGKAERIAVEPGGGTAEISRRMNAGWMQVDPPSSEVKGE
jgi:hypothetical protein